MAQETLIQKMIRLRIACPAGGYPYSEALYANVKDYERRTGMSFRNS